MKVLALKINTLALLRYSFAVLFLWFGYNQIINPEMWTAFLPPWLGYFPIPGEMIVQLNGLFELIAAAALVAGVFTRLVALVLGAHLMFIAIQVGGAIGMRDAVLAIIGLALCAADADRFTLDAASRARSAS